MQKNRAAKKAAAKEASKEVGEVPNAFREDPKISRVRRETSHSSILPPTNRLSNSLQSRQKISRSPTSAVTAGAKACSQNQSSFQKLMEA